MPKHMKPSILLGGWLPENLRRYKELEDWKHERLNAEQKNEFDKQFLLHVDAFLSQCKKSITLLQESCYEQWVEQTKKTKTICHQDFAAGNLLIDKKGNLQVFDMDSLTIDLPIRDMRKILNKVMKKRKKWSLDVMNNMVEAYQSINPLTNEQLIVLTADVLFPHLFYGQVSKYYEKREKEWTEEKHISRLKDTIFTELSKESTIKAYRYRL
ncbi:CotS family spore coat protein [Halalkalibacter kiskunsagensis]|uniref:CotS family spore coat protein n=1 Tax=Halalkalibacter kiskunsagensis TaxID=1548599 RepID=UPI00300823DE